MEPDKSNPARTHATAMASHLHSRRPCACCAPQMGGGALTYFVSHDERESWLPSLLLSTTPADLASAAAAVRAAMGPTTTVSISGLDATLTLDDNAVLALTSLALWIRDQAASAGGPRSCFGVAGAAGSGKTLTCELLRLALPAVGVPEVACVSMDSFHLPNTELEARGLQQHKGRHDTIDAPALAAALHALVHTLDTPVALPVYGMCCACQRWHAGSPTPPPRPQHP